MLATLCRTSFSLTPDTSYHLGGYANMIDTARSHESLWLELKCGFMRGIQAAR
jgi:hypothetical protein